MKTKLFIFSMLFSLIGCGGGGGNSNESSTQKDSSDIPTELGKACRADEPYYPLPEMNAYRKPQAGDSIEYEYELYATSIEDEELNREAQLTQIYYSVSDIDAITGGPTPPQEGNVKDWGALWTEENFVSSNLLASDSTEVKTSVYFYPGDESVYLIKNSNNHLFLRADFDDERVMWGQKLLPPLQQYTSFTESSGSSNVADFSQYWLIDTNFSVDNSVIFMTGIGCVETILTTKNETREWRYESILNNDTSDGGLEKIEIDTLEAVHPSIGSVISTVRTEYFFDKNRTNGEAVSQEGFIVSDVNFFADLPGLVIR